MDGTHSCTVDLRHGWGDIFEKRIFSWGNEHRFVSRRGVGRRGTEDPDVAFEEHFGGRTRRPYRRRRNGQGDDEERSSTVHRGHRRTTQETELGIGTPPTGPDGDDGVQDKERDQLQLVEDSPGQVWICYTRFGPTV